MRLLFRRQSKRSGDLQYVLQTAADLLVSCFQLLTLKYPKKGLFFTDESPENTDTKAYFTDIECLKKLQKS